MLLYQYDNLLVIIGSWFQDRGGIYNNIHKYLQNCYFLNPVKTQFVANSAECSKI